jgi:hypothetical protein
MGQGPYTMIAFGTNQVPEKPAGVEEDDWYGWGDLLEELGVRSHYQAQPYLAIPLAISDGWLKDHWGVPLKLEYAVLPLDQIHAFVQPHLEAAIVRWVQAMQMVADHGGTLPTGQLLLIDDSD